MLFDVLDFSFPREGYSGKFFRWKILALCRSETFEGLVVVKQYDALNVGSGPAGRKLSRDLSGGCLGRLRFL